jgi:anti-anti-sigma regulatory factor
VERLRESGYEVSFSGLKDGVIDAMKRTHLYEKIGEENMYPSQLAGISSIYARTHLESDEADCPLESMKPKVAELSLHTDGSLRNAKRHNLETCKHITALRFDSPLNQATSPYLENKIREKTAGMPDLKYVLIAAHAINEIDAYGVETIRQIVEWLRGSGYEIVFSGFKEDVMDTLRSNLLDQVIGKENMYPTQLQAVRGIYRKAHEGFDELPCPLMEVVPGKAEKKS